MGNTRKTAEITLEGKAISAEIVEAFDRFRSSGCAEARLRFAADTRPTPQLARDIAKELRESPRLQHLTLVHASTAIRFLASSISLQSPGALIDVDASGIKRRLTPLSPVPALGATVSEDAAVHEPLPEGIAVEQVELSSSVSGAVANTFVRLRSAHAQWVMLILLPETGVPHLLTQVLVDHIVEYDGLRGLILVHGTAAAGFVASTVGLRCPKVHVRAAANPEEGRRVLAQLMSPAAS